MDTQDSHIADLYQKYKALSPEEQRVVKVAAIIYGPFSQTKFMEIFNALNYTISSKKLNSNNIKSLLFFFENRGFLSRNNEACRSDIAFGKFLIHNEYKKDADFSVIAKTVCAMMPIFSYGFYTVAADLYERLVRNIRIAFYENDVKSFESEYKQIQTQFKNRALTEGLMKDFFPMPFDTEAMKKIDINFQFFMLSNLFSEAINEFENVDAYLDYALELIEAYPKENIDNSFYINLKHRLALIYFLKGDKKMLQSSPLSNHLIPLLQCFMDGKDDDVIAKSELMLKEYRKLVSNKGFFLTIEGVIYILALIRKEKTSEYSKIEAWLKYSIARSPIGRIFIYLSAVLLSIQNQRASAKNIIKNTPMQSKFEKFWGVFLTYCVDEALVQPSMIQSLYKASEKANFLWVQSELASLTVAVQPSNTEIVAKVNELEALLGDASLTKLIRRSESWETALNALISVSQGNGKNKRSAKENDARLIWLIDFEKEEIQPKEQTYGKSGWSSGRNVALTRLRAADVKSMTEQDRRICKAISIENFGWYGGQQSVIKFNKAVKEMVGHPLLFLTKSPNIAVQLIEDMPILNVKEEGSKGYSISFNVKIEEIGIKLVKETPTRYKLLSITDAHLRLATAMDGTSLFIPAKGKEKLMEALSGIANVVSIQSDIQEVDANLKSVAPDTRICVHLLPVGDGFHIELYIKPFAISAPYFKPGEGGENVIAEIGGERLQTKRNLKEEKKNVSSILGKVKQLNEQKSNKGTWVLENSEECLGLLVDLDPLQKSGEVLIEWPKGEKFKITKTVGFDQFSMSIKQKNDWFEVNGQLKIDENLVWDMQKLLEIANQKQQFIELSPGNFLALTNEFRRRLREVSALMNPSKNGIQLHSLSGAAMEDFNSMVANLEVDKKWKESVSRLENARKKKFKVPENFNATLRDYQKEGFEWLSRLAYWGVGACLADDMGLGKTVQGLALLTSLANKGASLVVAPASVCRNWVAEVEKFAPSLNSLLFGEGDREEMVKNAGKGDLVIVTYDLMQRESELFTGKKFGTIILDEAQAIKNRSTKRSETAMLLQADYKIIMTGTPLENHLGELWNLFQFANPGLLGSLQSFQENFAVPIEKYADEDRRNQLRKLIQPFILRRKKDEVLKELPPKTEIVLTVELSPEERAFYEALRRDAIAQLEASKEDDGAGTKHLKILAEIMRLRRACCNPQLVKPESNIESSKLRLFGEIVEELLENKHKALVFSQFVGHLALLENYLQAKNIKYQYLDGQTPLNVRQERINSFQNGEGEIFLISLKAGGTGLNLTAADYVLHMDPWWNPAVEDQASDRAHRIGQEKPVTVYRLVTEGTIEEKILKLHDQKRDLADSLLEGTSVGAKLSADDLLDLIKSR